MYQFKSYPAINVGQINSANLGASWWSTPLSKLDSQRTNNMKAQTSTSNSTASHSLTAAHPIVQGQATLPIFEMQKGSEVEIFICRESNDKNTARFWRPGVVDLCQAELGFIIVLTGSESRKQSKRVPLENVRPAPDAQLLSKFAIKNVDDNRKSEENKVQDRSQFMVDVWLSKYCVWREALLRRSIPTRNGLWAVSFPECQCCGQAIHYYRTIRPSMEWSGQYWNKKSKRLAVPPTLPGDNCTDKSHPRSADRGVICKAQGTKMRATNSSSTGHLVDTTTATVNSTRTAAKPATAISSRNSKGNIPITTASPNQASKRKISNTTDMSSPTRKRKMFRKKGLALDPLQIDILTQRLSVTKPEQAEQNEHGELVVRIRLARSLMPAHWKRCRKPFHSCLLDTSGAVLPVTPHETGSMPDEHHVVLAIDLESEAAKQKDSWLTGCFIDYVLTKFARRYKNVHFLPTRFLAFDLVNLSKCRDSAQKFRDHVVMDVMGQPVKLLQKPLIMFYNIGNKHWNLLIIKFSPRPCIELYEPMGKPSGRRTKSPGVSRRYLPKEVLLWLNTISPQTDPEFWYKRAVSAITLPHQTTSFDCGVACLLYAEKCGQDHEKEDINKYTTQTEITAYREVLQTYICKLCASGEARRDSEKAMIPQIRRLKQNALSPR